MTAATAPPVPPTPDAPTPAGGTVSFGSVTRSELTKLRSVRSTYWSFLAALIFTVAIGALAVNATATDLRHGTQDADFDPMLLSFVGLQLAQLAVGVLGVLAITGEYSSGMIRTTLTAVPRRLQLLFAKATAFAAVTLVASAAMCIIAFFVGRAIYGGAGLHYSLTGYELFPAPAPGRALIGAIAYLVLSGLLGFALGALIRRTPGAIVALVVLQFVAGGILYAISSAAGGAWDSLPHWLPTEAGQQAFTAVYHDGIHSAWGGLGVMAAWTVGFLALAAWAMQRRDA